MSVQDAALYILQFLSLQKLQLHVVITEKIEVRRGKGLFYDFKYTQTFSKGIKIGQNIFLSLFSFLYRIKVH